MNGNNHIIVGIGASAGGLQALREFFTCLPPQHNMAFVVVMHLLRDHPSQLHDLLDRFTSMPVVRITNAMEVRPGNIYVLPENHYLHIRQGRLLLTARDGLINNAVNIFFTSLAEMQEATQLELSYQAPEQMEPKVLPLFEENGGFVMVQDPESSQFNGMPLSAIKYDSPDVIDTPERLANFISQYSFSFMQQRSA